MNYFVIFKKQRGEIKPAYSYIDADTFDKLHRDKMILWYKKVQKSEIYADEQTEALLREFNETSVWK